jgi:antitoxin HicB
LRLVGNAYPTRRKNMNYPIVIIRCEEGVYVAEVPALKGYLAQGETLAETLEKLEVVKTLRIETAKRKGQPLPDVEGAIEKLRHLAKAISE